MDDSKVLIKAVLDPAEAIIKAGQFVPTVYRDVYPSVDPTSPALSQQGKSILITGGGTGIGRGIAVGLTQAGAKTIVLAGRTLSKLEAAKAELHGINKDVEVILVPTDVTKAADVENLRQRVHDEVGVPDILIHSAGSNKGSGTIADSDPEVWWHDTEINLKGSYLVMRAFLQLVGRERSATIVALTSISVLHVMPGWTNYHLGKLAATRMVEFVAAENPNVTAIALHPGMVATPMVVEDKPDLLPNAKDSVELAAGVAVYMCTPPARYLSGRYVSVNWSVDELKEREKDIVEKDLLKFDLKGEFSLDG